ncbi:MAG TPA: acetamidase/formamidase family protein [Gaiellaceae bacterium]
MIHEFEPTAFHLSIGSHEPALHVASGDTVRTWCVDSSGYDRNGEDLTDGGNPMTGPFHVEGAERGDTLAVRLDRVRPNRARGVSGARIAPNVLDPEFVPAFGYGDQREVWWTLDLEGDTARLEEPPEGLAGLGEVRLEPMVGCFGVAPDRGQAISTATSGPHGGNMDYRGFREGVTVYFPVAVEGALFHIGDGHALQGDGEIVGTGIEVSMDVEFTLEVVKKRIGWPRADDGTFVMAVGNARPLDQAVQHATTELVALVHEDYGLDYAAVSTLLGQSIRYEVGNVFDPAYTIVAKVEKGLLERL